MDVWVKSLFIKIFLVTIVSRLFNAIFFDKIKFVKRGNRVFYYKSSIDEFLKLIPSKKKQVI